MFYEIARAIIQRIFRDKILAGLVIVAVLAIFVGGFSNTAGDRLVHSKKDSRSGEQTRTHDPVSSPETANHEKEKTPDKSENGNQTLPKLDPELARQFVEWWVVRAMDFNPQTVYKNRQEAMTWITPETLQTYQSAFWPPEISEGIAGGRIQGNFSLASVKAVAVNPDGSVVINVCGNLVLQQDQKPIVQQLSTDYLIKRDTGGLRVSGLYNRAVLLQSTAPY